MKIKKLNESSLVDKKVSTLGKNGKTMYFTADQLKDAKAKYPEYDFEETTIDKSLPAEQKAYIAKKKTNECNSIKEDKGQARSSRYNTYKRRIEKAIKNNDRELLQRTKEAIMYAPAKELKNSDADELMQMIKGAKLSESKSIKTFGAKAKKLTESETQYGVHSFSQDAIIFRGTEEECGRYIDSHKELWDDAEVYRMEPSDPHYKKMNEASYGGAFDIEDGQYFTRDDLNDFAEEVVNHLNNTFNDTFEVAGCYIEDGKLDIEVEGNELGWYSEDITIDMRKIRSPKHLKKMYAFPVAQKLIKQISEYNDIEASNECLKENVRGMGEYSDKFYDYLDFLEDKEDEGNLSYLASQLIRYCKEDDLKDLWFDRMNKVAQDNGFGVEAVNDIDEGKKLKEDFDEEQVLRDAQRWFDVEIPDICKDVLDNLHTWPAYRVSYMNKLARDFYQSCARYSLQVRESLTEDVETPVLSAPAEGPESGLSSLLNTAMQDELKTIQMYNDISVTAKAEGFEDIASQVDEINTEENKHVGQLQELLKTIAPNAQAIDAGELEAGDALVTVEESINNSTETPNNSSEDIKGAVIMEGTERWKDIYQSFKNIEKELNGDGEAITAVIDRMYQDNKDDPDYKLAYDKWASNE